MAEQLRVGAALGLSRFRIVPGECSPFSFRHDPFPLLSPPWRALHAAVPFAMPLHSKRSPQVGRVHKWALGAFATLVDHPVAQSDVHIDVVRTPDGEPYLIIRDFGPGLSRDQVAARTAVQQPVQLWQASASYPCSWQAAAFRLGADVTVLTKNANASFAALLSRNRIADMFDPTSESPNVIVEWGHHLTDQDQRVAALCTYSPWNTVQHISNTFTSIPQTGTVLAISSLNRDVQQAQLELDIETDPYDIRLSSPSCTSRNHFMSSIRLSHSLRSYLELLYINPSFRIYLRGHPIRERRLFTTMYGRRDYICHYHHSLHSPSNPRHPPKSVAFRFGFDPDAHENEYGMLLYHNHRLVKPFVKLGSQVHPERQVRVVGVIDTTHLTPTPNMQSFEQDHAYEDLIFTLSQALNKYWAPYGSMKNVYRKHCNDPLQKWLRCDSCARWRQLAQDVSYPLISARVQWTCSMNDGATNECNVPDDVDHQPVPVERIRHGAKAYAHLSPNPRKRPRSPKTSDYYQRMMPNATDTVQAARVGNVHDGAPVEVPSAKTISPLPRLQTPLDFHSLTPELIPSDDAVPQTDAFSLRGSTSSLSKSTSTPGNMLEMAANAAPLSGAVYQGSSVKDTKAHALSKDSANSYELKRKFIQENRLTNVGAPYDEAERVPVLPSHSRPDPPYSPLPSKPFQEQHRNQNEPCNKNAAPSLNADGVRCASRETEGLDVIPAEDCGGFTQPHYASSRRAYSPNRNSDPSQPAAALNEGEKDDVFPRNVQLFEDKRKHHSQNNSYSDEHQPGTAPKNISHRALHTVVHTNGHRAEATRDSQELGRKKIRQQQVCHRTTDHAAGKTSSTHSTRKDKGFVKVFQSLNDEERASRQQGWNESKDMQPKPVPASAGAVPSTLVNDGVAEHSHTVRLSKGAPFHSKKDIPDSLGEKSKPVKPAHCSLQTPTRDRHHDRRDHCITASLPPIPGMPSPNTANSFLDICTENVLMAPAFSGIDMSRDFLNFGDIDLGLKTPSQIKPLSKKQTPSISHALTRNKVTPQRSGRFGGLSLHGAKLPKKIPRTERQTPSCSKEQPKSESKGVQNTGIRTDGDERSCHSKMFLPNSCKERRGDTNRATLKHEKVTKDQSEIKSNRPCSRMEQDPKQRRIEDSTYAKAGPADKCMPSELSAAIPWPQIAATAAAAGAFAAAAATAGNANGIQSQSRIGYPPPQESSTVKASKERINELREELREQKKQTDLFKGKLQELICCLAPAVNGGVTRLIKNLEEVDMSDLSDSIMISVSKKAKEEACRDQLQALQASRASEEIACASLEKLRRLVRTFLDEAVGMVNLDEEDKPIEKHLEEYLHLIDVLPPA